MTSFFHKKNVFLLDEMLHLVKMNLAILHQSPLFIVFVAISNFGFGFFAAIQLGALSHNTSSAPVNLGDGFFFLFSGPALKNSSLLPLIVWLIDLLFFLIFTGNLASKQFSDLQTSILFRSKSRAKWWVGVILTILLISIEYTMIILGSGILGLLTQLPWNTNLSSFFLDQSLWQAAAFASFFHILFSLAVLEISSFIVIALLQVQLTFLLKRLAFGISFILLLAAITWGMGFFEKIQGWQIVLLPTQSILSRHWPYEPALPVFTVQFSLLFNLIIVLVLCLGGGLLLRHYDFLGFDYDK